MKNAFGEDSFTTVTRKKVTKRQEHQHQHRHQQHHPTQSQLPQSVQSKRWDSYQRNQLRDRLTSFSRRDYNQHDSSGDVKIGHHHNNPSRKITKHKHTGNKSFSSNNRSINQNKYSQSRNYTPNELPPKSSTTGNSKCDNRNNYNFSNETKMTSNRQTTGSLDFTKPLMTEWPSLDSSANQTSQQNMNLLNPKKNMNSTRASITVVANKRSPLVEGRKKSTKRTNIALDRKGTNIVSKQSSNLKASLLSNTNSASKLSSNLKASLLSNNVKILQKSPDELPAVTIEKPQQISTDERDAAFFFFREKYHADETGNVSKTKKKRLTSLKKKILIERLNQYNALNPPSLKQRQSDELVIVRVDNFIFPPDYHLNDDNLDLTPLEDDDEYEELVMNVHEMAKKITNDNVRIFIPRKNGFGFGSVFVHFADKAHAHSAQQHWNGRTIQGCPISASLVPMSILHHLDDNQSKYNGFLIVSLENILNEDDLNDKDCLSETMDDIQNIASEFGAIKAITVDEHEYRVFVEFDGPNVAELAAEKLNGRLLSGETLTTKLMTNMIKLENFFVEDDIEDPECMQETLCDIRELSAELGQVKSIHSNMEHRFVYIEYKGGKKEAVLAAKSFEGRVLGGQEIFATSYAQEENYNNNSSIDEFSNGIANHEPMKSGNKIIPERYAECKRVPKSPNVGIPRSYVTQFPKYDDEVVVPLLNDLLGTLMRLQLRSRDDLNAKARRRIVMGLRETARGIRAGKIKMVVMAFNLDEYDALDDKGKEILHLTKNADVPIFFNLNKRKLGRALGKSIKVSIVGILRADGADEPFKKLKKLSGHA